MYYIPTFYFNQLETSILTCNMHGNEKHKHTPDSLQT